MADIAPFLATPASGCGPPVLILHSWWGLNRSFRDYAQRLADARFFAGCVDLYAGRVATTEEEAHALRAAPRREPMYRTIIRAIDFMSRDPRATTERVGLIGFSMGGHWAVWLTQRPELPVAATVLYYAARSADFGLTDWPVLAHFAAEDPFVSASSRRAMESALAHAERGYTAFDYPGTGHWFAESANAAFQPAAADLAFGRTVEFLRDAAA